MGYSTLVSTHHSTIKLLEELRIRREVFFIDELCGTLSFCNLFRQAAPAVLHILSAQSTSTHWSKKISKTSGYLYRYMYQSEKNIPKFFNYPNGASGNFCISLSLLVLNFGSTKTTWTYWICVSVLGWWYGHHNRSSWPVRSTTEYNGGYDRMIV